MNKEKMKKTKEEMKKTMKSVRKYGFGIYDTKNKLSIDPLTLQFIWRGIKRKKMKEEVCLHTDLARIEKIYKEKFGSGSSGLELDLFRKDIELFIERLIRSVEICTLKYVLNVGGGLNRLKRMNILKGKRKFVWEI